MTGVDEQLTLAAEFDASTYEQWRTSVDAILARGRGELSSEERERLFGKVLTTPTDDGIVLQPLYRAEDSPGDPGLPGRAPFLRGRTAAGPVPSGWDVRQRVRLQPSAPATNAAVLTELENGSTSIWLDADGQAPTVDALDAALSGVYLELVPIALAPGPVATDVASAMLALWSRRDVPADEARGTLGFDPVGRAAISGGVEDPQIGLATAAEVALDVRDRFPRVGTLVADGTIYHDAGAADADELALTLATALTYLRTLHSAGMSLDDAATAIGLRLAVSDNQFLSIAKLRASRRMWARVTQVAGMSDAARGARVHAVTSRAMLTRYDPWVNLLRTTVAGFAAGVGGADAVTVHPHDALVGEDGSNGAAGTRLARNVQTILIEESHLARVIDPAGGSWFVEKLTDDLARRAWERFTALERDGGVVVGLESGLVQRWLADTNARRADRVAHRRQPITGVSEFPNLADQAPPQHHRQVVPSPFPAVTPHFYAEQFERLRDRAAAAAAQSGQAPTVFLATLGPPAEHTARATFCTNLFAAGGIAASTAGTVTADSVADAFSDSGARLACICGTNERYAHEGVAVATALAAAGPARLYLAGAPGGLRADLEAAGVAEFVVAGDDAVALLDRALTAVGVQR